MLRRSYYQWFREPRWRNRFKLGIVVAILIEFAAVSLLQGGFPSSTSKKGFPHAGAPGGAKRHPAIDGDVRSIVSSAGYSLSFPAAWRAQRQGSRTVVVAPRNQGVVSAGVARPGALRGAVHAFLSSLRGFYTDVRITKSSVVKLGRRGTATYSGDCVNTGGVPLRFKAVVYSVAGRNYVVATFVASNASRELRRRVAATAATFFPMSSA